MPFGYDDSFKCSLPCNLQQVCLHFFFAHKNWNDFNSLLITNKSYCCFAQLRKKKNNIIDSNWTRFNETLISLDHFTQSKAHSIWFTLWNNAHALHRKNYSNSFQIDTMLSTNRCNILFYWRLTQKKLIIYDRHTCSLWNQ